MRRSFFIGLIRLRSVVKQALKKTVFCDMFSYRKSAKLEIHN